MFAVPVSASASHAPESAMSWLRKTRGDQVRGSQLLVGRGAALCGSSEAWKHRSI